ncbi:DUF6455 family protein [Roseovarius autotrophicus]|uniref:DUF6455 family protein n=1 Tax=Roseovarius autotrophicus TaxID=2824121 RepID=UPI0019D9CD25|nr:DUF6455 family protein [Roseovarius autotrophicus]MBE0455183.1 hypothetical protein [Roseovarius sp.]
MQRTRTLKHHADLVDRMASAQGVDLEQKVMEGLLTPDDISTAVLACTGCSSPGDCEHWLASHETGAPAPSYCRNVELFEDIKASRRV